MYDIKWIRENVPAFDKGLSRRGMPNAEREALIANILGLDEARRGAILKFEQAQARRNAISKEIGEAKKAKDEARANKVMAEVTELKAVIPQLEADAKKFEEQLSGPGGILATVPNLPADDVPDGTDEHGNVEHHQSGAKRSYAFKPKQHFELGEALGQMDFELAAKLSGARFVVLQKGLARMERALGQLFLDTHTSEKHGYTEVSPPLMVRDEAMYGTAQLPKFLVDQYFAQSGALEPSAISEFLKRQETLGELNKLERDLENSSRDIVEFIKRVLITSKQNNSEEMIKFLESINADRIEHAKEIVQYRQRESFAASLWSTKLWLIPTAEVPLTNLVRESIVDEDKLPLRLTACTPCFRAEAGAAGKDTRGMIRQHQFTKVELVSITTPEKSKEEHERMLACAEEVLKKLDLHYRVVTLCTGDMGFAAQKTYDIEVWLPGQAMYREISSCSNCGEFQARRMNARYRSKDGVRHVHTLNGSGVAVGRALIAVMENYQDDNGAIVVPEALKPYMGGLTKIERA
jgi:seryl-tRNA synthetase